MYNPLLTLCMWTCATACFFSSLCIPIPMSICRDIRVCLLPEKCEICYIFNIIYLQTIQGLGGEGVARRRGSESSKNVFFSRCDDVITPLKVACFCNVTLLSYQVRVPLSKHFSVALPKYFLWISPYLGLSTLSLGVFMSVVVFCQTWQLVSFMTS